jgi:glycosyltransferase involved in cell wall biosynthesis
LRAVLRYNDTQGPNGIKRYSVTLGAALARLGVDVRYSRVYTREFKVGRLKVGGLVVRRLTESVLPIPRGDVLHATTFHMNPKRRPADVVTIHDIMQVRRPELYPQSAGLLREIEALLRLSFRNAWMVADSRYTRDEVMRQYPDAPRERIVPVHLGVDHEQFWPDPRATDPANPVLRAMRPGMLNVAVLMNIELRKRLDLVLEAAAELPFVRIVHAGWPHVANRHQPIVERVAGLIPRLEAEGRYVRLGALADDDIRVLLSNADLVLHASEEEGFGLPPLEALACGARVLASDIPPHAEVLGKAAVFFPLSRDGIRKALESAWDGEAVRADRFPRREAAIAHAKGFTWEKTARETLKVYEAAVRGR